MATPAGFGGGIGVGPGTEPGSYAAAPDGASGRATHRSATFWVKSILVALVAMATSLLVVQNGDSTDLTWLTFDFAAPLWLLLLLSAGAGTTIGLLLPPVWRHLRRRRDARSPSR